ncbi:hypothetical protein OGATHE_003461 [Ogataea polymorpha]|uniref:Uncharacterized protein n=1 Tax=Ogataea polymorpha TaxID=460523 RepID=A0A9P8P405_9ASCO|nr:hypothetical protein OGATHE_003461 [Ogataea polymorpha]
MSPLRFQLKIFVSWDEDVDREDLELHVFMDALSLTVDVLRFSLSQILSSSSSSEPEDSSSESIPLCITKIASSIALTSSSMLSIRGAYASVMSSMRAYPIQSEVTDR